MMNILFIGVNDWANVCHNWARALNQGPINVRANVIVREPHPFYEQNVRTTDKEFRTAVFKAQLRKGDWIFWTGDGDYEALAKMLEQISKTWRNDYKLACRHPGTAYRHAPLQSDINDDFFGFRLRLFHPELYRFRAKAKNSWPYIHTSFLEPANACKVASGYPAVIHCPSSSRKGTNIIRERCTGSHFVVANGSFVEVASETAYFYFRYDQWDKELRTFGATAIETCALQRVPILPPLAAHHFRAFEDLEIENPVWLEDNLQGEHFEFPTYNEWLELADMNRKWFEKNASPTVVANYLKKRLEQCA